MYLIHGAREPVNKKTVKLKKNSKPGKAEAVCP